MKKNATVIEFTKKLEKNEYWVVFDTVFWYNIY